MQYKESAEQIALFNWIGYNMTKYPELELCHAIPNGGKRNAKEAARMKREGVKAGVSDIFLPVARRGYHGLYIEMKVDKGKLSDAQGDWIKKVTDQGYHATVCYSWGAAVEVLEWYLRGEA